ncbi:MAG: hypothetical protein AAF709_09710 [Pseudomonadota bacterium]
MPKVFDQLSVLERFRFVDAYKLRMFTLIYSRSALKSAQLTSASEQEEASFDLTILEVEQDIAALKAHLIAFEAGRGAISPPTTTQLATLKEQMDKVERINNQQEAISGLLGLIAESAATYNQIIQTD